MLAVARRHVMKKTRYMRGELVLRGELLFEHSKLRFRIWVDSSGPHAALLDLTEHTDLVLAAQACGLALQAWKRKRRGAKAARALAIVVDDAEPATWAISFRCSNMSCTQGIATLECTKAELLAMMGYGRPR